jgi:hypothetical protein
MAEVCPISFDSINEKVARLNGITTTICLLAFIFTPFKAIIIFLAYDFLMRGFLKPKFSVLANLSKFILKMMKSKPKMTNAGPKKFAAKLGFIFSLMVIGLQFSGLSLFATIIAGVFAFFAFLEGAFGFCVACKVYPILLKFTHKS